MKKYLLLTACLILNVAHGQLHPVKNLTYQQAYNYPGYSYCPQFNCFWLSWSKPDNSPNDILIGYNIYQNDSLYKFLTDTSYGCSWVGPTPGCNASTPNWYFFLNPTGPFWVTVKAVYNQDSATSPANDSTYVYGAAINVNEINQNKYLTVSPSPFSSQTTLQIKDRLQSASLTVYNSVGQTVKRMDDLTGQTIIFHRDNLPSGLYFARLTQSGETLSTDKLIIMDR